MEQNINMSLKKHKKIGYEEQEDPKALVEYSKNCRMSIKMLKSNLLEEEN